LVKTNKNCIEYKEFEKIEQNRTRKVRKEDRIGEMGGA